MDQLEQVNENNNSVVIKNFSHHCQSVIQQSADENE